LTLCFANALCIMPCSGTIWLYLVFLTNLEDEISFMGEGFVRPKIGRRKKINIYINNEIKISRIVFLEF
jgi:hypothetical protein